MDTKIQNVIEEVSRIFEVDLKEKQIVAMQTFMSGRDVFVTLQTGYGKSLIYAFYLLLLIFSRVRNCRLL